MRSRTEEFTMYGLKSRTETNIDIVFVKTETNTGPIDQFNCYLQQILWHLDHVIKCDKIIVIKKKIQNRP